MKKYDNGKYIEITSKELQQMKEEQAEFEKSAEYKNIKIEELKQKLADTDYVIIKIAEGSATVEEYATVINQRKQWREEINKLENEVITDENNFKTV